MNPQFAAVCAARRSCHVCLSSAAWRQFMGAPAVCPYGIVTASPAVSTLPDATDAEISRREAICRECEHFNAGAGCRQCHCPDAKKRPWIERNECRFWVPHGLAQAAAGATVKLEGER